MLSQDEFWQRFTPHQAARVLWYYDKFKGIPSPAVGGYEPILFEAGYLNLPSRASKVTGAWAFTFSPTFTRDLPKFRALAAKENE